MKKIKLKLYIIIFVFFNMGIEKVYLTQNNQKKFNKLKII